MEPLLDKFKDDIKEDDQLKKDYKSGKEKRCSDGELHELCSKESMQSDLIKLAFDLPFMSKKQRKAFKFN